MPRCSAVRRRFQPFCTSIFLNLGFSTWSEMLDHLGIPHDKVEPLRVSYRSTREIVECATHDADYFCGEQVEGD